MKIKIKMKSCYSLFKERCGWLWGRGFVPSLFGWPELPQWKLTLSYRAEEGSQANSGHGWTLMDTDAEGGEWPGI